MATAKSKNADAQVNMLSLAEIQEIDDITEETLYVEPWKGHVRIRSISKRQMNKIKSGVRAESEGDPDPALIEKHIFINGLVEPKVSEDEYDTLLDKSGIAMDTILNAILGTSKAKGKEDVKKEERQFPAGR